MKQHIGKIICGLMIVLIVAGVWYHRAVNTIFPLDEDHIFCIFVSEKNDLYQSAAYDSLPEDMEDTLITLFNTLTLQKDDIPFVRHSQELGKRQEAQNVLYEVNVQYNEGLRGVFMRSSKIDLHICADGRIIVWNGGYEYYDLIDGDLDALLTYLAICDKECFGAAMLQDGTIIREK